MDNLPPVGLAEAGEAMLGYARMTEAIDFKQLAVDKGVLRVNMKNPRAELVNVRHRINELANQMAGVPLKAEVFAGRLVEEPFPHRGLGQHIVAHDGEMIWTHRAMLESEAHALVRREFGDRLPKLQQPRQKVLEGFIDGIVALRVGLQFNHRARKT